MVESLTDIVMCKKHPHGVVFVYSDRVQIRQRGLLRTLQAKGIYPTAKVVRGPDWKYGEQDGKSIFSNDQQSYDRSIT